MKDFRSDIQKYLETEIQVLKSLDLSELNDAVGAILAARDRGAAIYTMGNGGSSATASHMVCDLSKGIYENIGGKKFLCECLSDNVPTITAIANDLSYDDIFSFQLKDKLCKGDLVIAISGSGNSKNIIKAVEFAKSVGAVVVGITGYSGGKLRELCDYSMHAAIDDMQISEDVHMIFDHMLMRIISDSESK
ncbi:MAG: SIS domain-containing protein [Ruminococcaceae bacterium]|nr:SIS domain-containing protein [Oscillospiraceae bacterium]